MPLQNRSYHKRELNGLAEMGARDFNGRQLCVPCWNGYHFGRGERGNKVHLCDLGYCECICREQIDEKFPRVKKDRSAQQVIDTGEDVIHL